MNCPRSRQPIRTVNSRGERLTRDSVIRCGACGRNVGVAWSRGYGANGYFYVKTHRAAR